MLQTNVARLDPIDQETEEWCVVIETPKGSHNKYALDQERGAFELSGVLPEGMSFPYDFGFIPYTHLRGKKFKVIGLRGPKRAEALAQAAVKQFKKRHGGRKKVGTNGNGKR